MKSRRALLSLLTVVGIVSIALNVFLFRQGDSYFREINANRLDPVGVSVYPTEGTPLPAGASRRVVFFGDSRALMWKPPAGLQGVEIVNRGIGNQTTAQILERLERHVRPLQPAVVVLEAGVNDLKTIPLFPARRDALVRDCIRNLEEIVTRLRGLGATVVLTTIFPLGRVPLVRKPFWSDDVARSIEEVNASLRSLAARMEHVVLFDAYPILLDSNQQVAPAYSYDLLHLSPNGYDALNPKLVSLLAPIAAAP